ncbi:MAG: GTPase HflX [Chloroflexota bacterium]
MQSKPVIDHQTALIVGTEMKRSRGLMPVEASLDELAALVATAGAEATGRVYQKLENIDPATYVGSGKVQEIKILADELDVNMVIFDDELSPRHQRELEDELGEDILLLDRTALILDIFAQHARTSEGQLQVELAQLEYRLPRLTRMWTHLVRQAGGRAGGSGGGVGLRGPGETQLEVDRRMINQRISQLRKELGQVRAHRARHRQRRQQGDIPLVALVGYTNAGKSTLLNRVSGSSVLTADKLFATLDPTTRRVQLPEGRSMMLTDTVGFIHKLPTMLVAAFRATLEEVTEANLLIHVVDGAHPFAKEHTEAVKDTLAHLAVDDLPMITALNKIDLLDESDQAALHKDGWDDPVLISAVTGAGLDDLLARVEKAIFRTWINIRVLIPYDNGRLTSLFHSKGKIQSEEHTGEGVVIIGSLPIHLVHHFQDLLLPAANADPLPSASPEEK